MYARTYPFPPLYGALMIVLVTLALWSPSPVELGAVGYHSKPSGTFVTLFNAFRPLETSKGKTVGMPSLNGYGKVSVGDHRAEKRNAVKRKLDQFQDWWSRGRNECSECVFHASCWH